MALSEKLKERIAKIVRLMNDAGTEGEAIAAAAALQRLCVEHNLSQAEVEASVQEDGSESVDDFQVWSNTRRDNSIEYLASVIAGNFRCGIYIRRKRGFHDGERLLRNCIHFVGLDDDVSIASTCFTVTLQAMRNLLRLACKKHGLDGRSVRQSYCIGFIDGLSCSFEKQKNATQDYAIVLQTPAVVLSKLDELNLKEAQSWAPRVYSSYRDIGFEDGISYGEGMKLHESSPVESRCF